MIPKVVKGGDMRGLLRYLQGEGRANEHTEPHVVSGDSFLVAWHGAEVLDRDSAHQIAAYLDEPRRVYDVQMRAEVTQADPETGDKVVLGYKKQDTWHCSLSIAAEEGPLSNERWDAIAREFMDDMGFTGASGKAPARWVAIHHGVSVNGNDHIHIAASMVREDGTRWEGRFRDYRAAQEACRRLEVRHGLARVEGRARGVFERGEKRWERARAERSQAALTPPQELAQRLRRAAVASTSEAEWIRRVRADGVVVKPYFAKGTTDVVNGYKAALKPGSRREPLVFYGGGKLGQDLTLPRVRENWPAAGVEDAQAASAEWQAAFRGQPPVHQGRETRPVSGQASHTAAVNLAAFNDRLAGVPIGDQVAWADAARDVSGALSAWARYDPAHGEELRKAAAALGRSAQTQRTALPPGRRVRESPMGTALLFMQARREDRPKIAGLILMQQVMRTATALRDYHSHSRNLREAQRIHTEVIARLERVQASGLGGYSREPVPALLGTEDRAAYQARRVATAGQVPAAPGRPAETARSGPGGEPLPRRLRPGQDKRVPSRGDLSRGG